MLSYTPIPAAVGIHKRSVGDVSAAADSPSVMATGADAAAAATAAAPARARDDRHIWIITGPAGCGKSTVAYHLAHSLNLPYIEGDEFHPPSNIAKMAAGQPLTDADRWDWLIALREASLSSLISAGASGVVLTCSALKKKYRDVIRLASYDDSHVHVHFVYLRADKEILLKRVKARQGHFMKEEMVQSQFHDLEEPGRLELDKDCLIVDVGGSMVEVMDLALATVKKALENVVAETIRG